MPDPPMYPCASIHTPLLLLGTAQLIFTTLFSLDVPSLSSPNFSCTNRLHWIWHGLIYKGKNKPIILLFCSFCQASHSSFARCFFLDFFLKISISFSVQLFNLAFYWLSVFLLQGFTNTLLVLPFPFESVRPGSHYTYRENEGGKLWSSLKTFFLHQTTKPQYDLLSWL